MNLYIMRQIPSRQKNLHIIIISPKINSAFAKWISNLKFEVVEVFPPKKTPSPSICQYAGKQEAGAH